MTVPYRLSPRERDVLARFAHSASPAFGGVAEPSVPILSEHTISNRAPSAARASLRLFAKRIALSALRLLLMAHGLPTEALAATCALFELRWLNRLACQTKPWRSLAERVGFEPTSPFGRTAFRERRLKPLGNLSGDPSHPKSYVFGLSNFSIQRVANFALRASLAKGFYYAAACHPKPWRSTALHRSSVG